MQVLCEFKPGLLGEAVALHGRYYAEHWGFQTFFEAKVAHEMAEFATRCAPLDPVLFAEDEQGLSASLVLDLNDPASGSRGAHLRWFITEDRCRGTGIGRRFLKRAMDHADRHCAGRAWLTTFAGLGPARHLYESFGFDLAREQDGEAWGTRVCEQEFRRGATL